mmetsp:Transcript_8605/g.21172  ORF Transcript_8605/g.21172 Transcript_8605/m.21172 type:complete len:102 (+) Transcript_8605:141-446(+)
MSALAGIDGLRRDSSLNGSIVLDEEEENDSSLSGSESRDLSERDQESTSGTYSERDGWMLGRNLGTDRFISASRCIFFYDFVRIGCRLRRGGICVVHDRGE